ncbi:TetR/AcrR family transcriptional regulator [Modestobacter roseus]|uniref:TetR family transcriptional regulator n=1 Tax=Modestobacter roseus TaxID=1181884 RepID=A0A562IWE7_9ACTN|nr:TetR/AcrR family transcriptional regulator [Modestobacter roseus]MQA35790.1 TetR family transcriptional regulator [Modestobacter roseus]TWH75143.1 TetR family transcriptional regulator [Modestobacter roseus]
MTTAAPTSEARERLLRTASTLFYAEGLRAVGVDRVIAEASVTRATFYRHFPGKEDLVVAYLHGVDRAVRDRAGVVPTGAAEAARWLHALTAMVGDTVCGVGFRGCAFINAAAEYPDPASPVRRAVRAHREWLEDGVRTAFATVGHPDPADAARRWLVLRDGAMVAGYLADPAHAQATLEAGVRELLAQAPAS